MCASLAFLLAAGFTGASGDPSRGQILCDVPSPTYPTIASAIDSGCEDASVQAGDYVEDLLIDRVFRMSGSGAPGATRILGDVQIDTASLVELDNIVIERGAGADLIFADGFESGDTDAWSGSR